MGLPVHDKAASTANLARMLREGLDLRSDTTSVRTATLKLLLDTLIAFSEPRHEKQDTQARATVQSMLDGFKNESDMRSMPERGGAIGRL